MQDMPWIRYRRFVRSLLVSCLAVICAGCLSVSRHRGIATVPQPTTTEQDAGRWYAFYEDQFDAFEGTVLPPSDSANDAQKQGYQRAASDWQRRVVSKAWKQSFIWAGLAVGVSLLTIVLVGASAPTY